MPNFVRSKAWLIGLALLSILSISMIYGLRKDSYLLNRNTRIVCMRIFKFKELSLHRGYTYRIQFGRHDYRVQTLPRGPGKEWQDVEAYPYEGSIESATPGLAVVFRHGDLVSFTFGERRERPRSHLIVYFFHPEKPSRRKGVVFYQSGGWRAL